MPNKNALAAANTIGKLFQPNNNTGAENMNSVHSSRSSSRNGSRNASRNASLTTSSANYSNDAGHQRTSSISRSATTTTTFGAPSLYLSRKPSLQNSHQKVRGKKSNSRTNSLASSSSSVFRNNVQLPPPRRASSDSLPLGSSSPLRSLSSNNDNCQKGHHKLLLLVLHVDFKTHHKPPRQQRSVQSLTIGNTKQNEALDKPRMVTKTVPTAYGLKTIQVPAESASPSASRTSSLLGNRTYIPKHSSFTVSSINEKHKLQKKLNKQPADHFDLHDRNDLSSLQFLQPQQTQQHYQQPQVNKSPASSLKQQSSSSSLLQPPGLSHSTSKAKKRVSFTEDSPDHSILSNSIVEVPDQEDDGEALEYLSSPARSVIRHNVNENNNSYAQGSPLKSALHDSPSNFVPEPPINEKDEHSSQVPEFSTENSNKEEASNAILEDDTEATFSQPATDQIPVPVQNKEPSAANIADSVKEGTLPSSGPHLNSESAVSNGKSSDNDSRSDIIANNGYNPSAQEVNNLTPETTTSISPEVAEETKAPLHHEEHIVEDTEPEHKISASLNAPPVESTDVDIHAPSVPTPPPIKPSSEIAEKLKQSEKVKEQKIQKEQDHKATLQQRQQQQQQQYLQSAPTVKKGVSSNQSVDSINSVPFKSPSRKSKRNSVPARIPLAHALEKSDTLSGYRSADPHKGQKLAAKHQQHRQSLPVSRSPSMRLATLRDAEVPTKTQHSTNAGGATGGAQLSRSRSSMRDRSFRSDLNANPNASNNASLVRSQSAMGNRTFRQADNATPNSPSQQPPHHRAQLQHQQNQYQRQQPLQNNNNNRKVRPKSEIGSRHSLRNAPSVQPKTSTTPNHGLSSSAARLEKHLANDDLRPKSSFEKIRPTENNLAFKRLSMRDHNSSASNGYGASDASANGINGPISGNALSPQSTNSAGAGGVGAGGAGNGGRGFGLFKSRFEDSDDEDSYDNSGYSAAGIRKFAHHSLRQPKGLSRVPENQQQQTPQQHNNQHVSLPPKTFGFARHRSGNGNGHGHGNGTAPLGLSAGKSATPDILPQGTPLNNRYDEPDALKTPSSSINSEKLFEKHLKESKKHSLFSQFEHTGNGQGHNGRRSKLNQQHPDLDAFVDDEPKKKKIGGRLRKLFGGK